MQNAKSSNGLERMLKVAALSAALYAPSMIRANEAYAQEQPKDTVVAGKSYRCSPAILTENIRKRTCVYSDNRIPINKGEVTKVDTLFVTDTIYNTVVKTDTVKRVVEDFPGEVELPPVPTAMAPPLRIENDDGSCARFHFNPFGGKNDVQVGGFEAGLVCKFLGVSVNYARGFTDVKREMIIPAPHNRLDIGTDTKSGLNIYGVAGELHLFHVLFAGVGYNLWNQNRDILERKVALPDSTDLAVNSHSHVENGRAWRFFGGLNLPISRKVSIKLIGGMYKDDKKSENSLGKPIYFAGAGASLKL